MFCGVFFPFKAEVEIGWEGTLEDLNWVRGGAH